MEYTVSASVFASFWTFASADLFEAMTELALYGVLVVLVAFAAALLCRPRAGRTPVLAISTVLMFVLATVQLAARLRATASAFQVFYLAVQGQFTPQSPAANGAMAQYIGYNFAEDILLVTNNIVTDGLLIYRCFLIWDRNRYIVVVPTLMLLLTAILSYLSAYEGDYPTAAGPSVPLPVGFSLGLLTNIVLVGLTAGRILYTRFKLRGLQNHEARRYNTAAAMITESGAIVCAWTVVYVIVRSLSPPTVWRIFRGGLAQILNIVPILIVVRVGLGHSLQGTETQNKTLTDEKWKAKTSASSEV
ncbi:hypothetical protein DFH07DRAFT_956844 [Mycena maculata]|uniref:Uncharacterized protein n=1 Tax=Mycena maculata TaxID=230809 RepID=A0AAD7JFP7_9AGAR|nr:hypothetical protein DFH07DRAFT_956844 [Mycena maculata]